jgi:metal-responsive CopG/Arc/MetJ family transcriptional regulator
MANTMAFRKTAIAVPEDLLADVDKAAQQRGESRSRYITTVLRAAVRVRRDQEITRRLNALFADERADREQSKSAANLDELGSDWTDERW